MAITYFNSASTPADNGTSTGTPIAVTPPGSMVTGDLVVMFGYYRGNSTIAVSATGGQTWSTAMASTNSGGSTISYFVTWCRYNGTWGANPSLSFSTSSTNCNVVMHVFRPTTGTNVWALEATTANVDRAAPATPFAVTCVFNQNAVEFENTSLFSDGSLAAYWKMESATADVGGSGFDLTNTSVTFTAGLFGNAANINTATGTSDRLEIASGLGIALTGAVTYSCWVKMGIELTGATTETYRILDWREGTRYLILDYSQIIGPTRRLAFDASGSTANYNIELGLAWHHICITQPSSGTARVYLDGVQVISVGKGGSGAGTCFTIGNTINASSLNSWAGLIDDVAIFTRELSATEVALLANSSTHTSTVQIGGVITDDDNTWGTLSGTGFALAGTAQYRNTSGNDSSSTYAYRIGAGGGFPPFVVRQATNGGDPAVTLGVVFYEGAAPTTTLKDMIGMGIIPYLR